MRYYLRSHSFCVCQYPFVARLLQHIDLNADDLKTFEALIVDEVTVSRRRDLIVDGYEYRKLSFIRDGYAVRYKLLRNGKRQILNVLLPGDIVGIPGSFLERAVYSVTAITDVTMNVCSLDSYVQLCYRRPQFGLALTWIAVQEAAIYAEQSSMSAAGRRSSGCRIFSSSFTSACTLLAAPTKPVSPCRSRRK